jgi:hypothetical protein
MVKAEPLLDTTKLCMLQSSNHNKLWFYALLKMR